MTFKHITLEKQERPFVKQLDREDGHYYQTKDGTIYPSITTIKNLTDPKTWFPFWIKKIMRDNCITEEEAKIEAKRIGDSSMKVGTALHQLAEDYMNGGYPTVYDSKDFEKNPNTLFVPLKDWLDEHVDNVYATESKISRKELQFAGTVDWVAEVDGVLTIGDYKNARKPKMPSNILQSKYYEQATAYSIMFEECYGIKVEQIAIVVISWDGKVRMFKSKPENHLSSLYDMILKYESNVNI